MSIVALATGEPTCTLEDLKKVCEASKFSIQPDSLNETAFLLFANSFDSVCQVINNLPEYRDPRLQPVVVEGGERKFHKPRDDEDPLNGWAHKARLVSADPKAREGPLAGRTVAFKDNVSVGGLPLGLGCSPKHFKDGKHPISTIDASVVKRVLEAGGIVKGTANCENFSMFPVSYTSYSGAVHNAWLPGYATGGSSSGCGTLVSVGDVENERNLGKDDRTYSLGEGVDLAIGGDQGGSIRLPAAYSGIYGLKPTHGLIPYTGIASLNPLIDHTGPMARTVEDVALLLGALAGYDGIDPRMTPESPLREKVPDYLRGLKSWMTSKQQQNEWTSSTAAKGLRVGILKESFEVIGLDSSIVSTVKTAAQRYLSLGADVKEVSIPEHHLGAAVWTVAGRAFMPHKVDNRVSDLLEHPLPGLDPLPVDQGFYDVLAHRNPAILNVLLNAAHIEQKYGPALVRKAYMHIHQLRAAYDKAFEDVDVLLTPVNPTVGPPHPESVKKTEQNPNGWTEKIMDLFEPAIGNTMNTCPFNVTGHPGMSMPVGWGNVKGSEGRLPVGMQLVAKRFDELSILKAAKAWEMGGRWQDS
ncbi:Amidase [Pseudocercospora fuligena]|uniref:Amidase n=1 Tax=Pseudocercospora fuligena TaxID=685502 RepID=A0A8H6RB66_9PEZI|nr:Amidase [Pseudocercospora fuligena]